MAAELTDGPALAGAPRQAKRIKQCTDAFLELVRKGPDGTSSQSMGRAAVCWQCGYVGLPKNADAGGRSDAVAQCGGCGCDDQTNYVKCKQPDGSVVPWMENKVRTVQGVAACCVTSGALCPTKCLLP